MNEEYVISPLAATHWPEVRRIYQEGIATGQATFEVEVPTWQQWDAQHHSASRLIARFDSGIVGWAALSPVSRRVVYNGVAEVSVYVSAAARRQGVGHALLTRLIEESESAGLWTLQAGIFPENSASVALHTGCGFRVVGQREKIGMLQGVWRDVLLLERRSTIVGRDDA